VKVSFGLSTIRKSSSDYSFANGPITGLASELVTGANNSAGHFVLLIGDFRFHASDVVARHRLRVFQPRVALALSLPLTVRNQPI
jgi:hypothetical protein